MILIQKTLLPYRAALHRPVVEVAETRDDPEAGDTLYRQLFTDLL